MTALIKTIEDAIRARLQRSPGCLDHLLINNRGVRFVQAVHGDQPLAAGFDICASAVADVPIPPPAPNAARWAALAAALLCALALALACAHSLRSPDL